MFYRRVASLMVFSMLGACGNEPIDTEQTTEVAGPKADYVASATSANVEKYLAEGEYAFRLNLTTNKITMYEKGKAIDQWNVVTGDIHGRYHDHPSPTPEGIFSVHRIQYCPAWTPSSGASMKPCQWNNPLGQYVLWFQGYWSVGLHGNYNTSFGGTADSRRRSGGCVRNPNAKIQEVFNRVVHLFKPQWFPGKDYAELVRLESQKPASKRQDLTGIPKGSPNIFVAIKYFGNSDPEVGSTVENEYGTAYMKYANDMHGKVDFTVVVRGGADRVELWVDRYNRPLYQTALSGDTLNYTYPNFTVAGRRYLTVKAFKGEQQIVERTFAFDVKIQ